ITRSAELFTGSTAFVVRCLVSIRLILFHSAMLTTVYRTPLSRGGIPFRYHSSVRTAISPVAWHPVISAFPWGRMHPWPLFVTSPRQPHLYRQCRTARATGRYSTL